MSDHDQDGAPDCRLCGDEGYYNGHSCNHRDTRVRNNLAAILEYHSSPDDKNWCYAGLDQTTPFYIASNGQGMSLKDALAWHAGNPTEPEPAVGDRYEDAPF